MPRFSMPVLGALLDQGLLPDRTGERTAAELLAVYDRAVPEVERRMWQADDAGFARWLASYQALCRERQALIDRSGCVDQHQFLIGIPVADRPAHLEQCLDSILQQCRLYDYGGQDAGGRWRRIRVVVAEDSREPRHVAAHRALVERYRREGLDVVHFDLPEQHALLQAIPEAERAQLGRLLTTQPAERFYQKGQAANRNLCTLKLLQLTEDRARTLYYLVDSDQSFLVNRPSAAGEQIVPALNYFHTIDHLFRTSDIRMLTGKLVGDPPVSPAVMAANFLDDVAAFLTRIGASDPLAACSFHAPDAPLPGDAAYHDLAQLFGFDEAARPFDYRCPLDGPHDHAACLAGFANRLQAFFFGEHLTRRTVFRYTGAFTELAPARTIYPGNYIVDFEGLKYIIPFGHLRLRMSGPTAGRLVQAEIGARFATANLPMLHRRTAAADLQGEFRPGVAQRGAAAVDISDEFERQFFGDLMLFSVVAWLKQHDLAQLDDADALAQTVAEVEADLLDRYGAKQRAVEARLAELERWLAALPAAWRDAAALQPLHAFLRNIAANFGAGAPAWRQINADAHRAARRAQIVDALFNYRRERAAWDRLVSR